MIIDINNFPCLPKKGVKSFLDYIKIFYDYKTEQAIKYQLKPNHLFNLASNSESPSNEFWLSKFCDKICSV